jgi:hypothetical protein
MDVYRPAAVHYSVGDQQALRAARSHRQHAQGNQVWERLASIRSWASSAAALSKVEKDGDSSL